MLIFDVSLIIKQRTAEKVELFLAYYKHYTSRVESYYFNTTDVTSDFWKYCSKRDTTFVNGGTFYFNLLIFNSAIFEV